MTDEDYKVYIVQLPGDVNSAVRVDVDGFASIYINDALAPKAARKALKHELRHFRRDDFYNDLPISEIEAE